MRPQEVRKALRGHWRSYIVWLGLISACGGWLIVKELALSRLVDALFREGKVTTAAVIREGITEFIQGVHRRYQFRKQKYIEYEYEVSGHSYKGVVTQNEFGYPDPSRFQIDVTYLPSSPEKHLPYLIDAPTRAMLERDSAYGIFMISFSTIAAALAVFLIMTWAYYRPPREHWVDPQQRKQKRRRS